MPNRYGYYFAKDEQEEMVCKICFEPCQEHPSGLCLICSLDQKYKEEEVKRDENIANKD